MTMSTKQPTLAFMINGKTYKICASDNESIRNLPKAYRPYLLTLLEAVKQQDDASLTSDTAKPLGQKPLTPKVSSEIKAAGLNPVSPSAPSERMSSGDIDNVMARLIMEDKENINLGITKKGMVIFVVILMLIILSLMFVF
ncbi:MAG: hypothetical protein ACI93R_001634 [Flavobacteriales bacterium]|jgi:hypothetical protein